MRHRWLVGSALGLGSALVARLIVACADFGADAEPLDGGIQTGTDTGADVSMPAEDAQLDAGGDVAELPPLCSRVDATFCWTFETEAGPALAPDFPVGIFVPEMPVGFDASPPTVSSVRAVSAPASMRTNAVPGVFSRMVHRLTTTPTTIHHCEVDLFVEKVGSRPTTVLQFSGAHYTPSIVLTPTTGKVAIFFFGLPTPDPKDLGDFAPDKWIHVAFEETLSGGVLSLRGALGGTALLEHTGQGSGASFQNAGSVVGLAPDTNDPNATEWIVWYDNYWCHTR